MRKILNKTWKIVLALLIANILVFGFYIYFFSHIKTKNENISRSIDESQYDKEKEAVLAAAKESLEFVKADTEKFDSFIIPKEGVLDFIKKIETIGKNSGSNFEINIAESEEKGKMVTFTLSVRASGSWANVFKSLSLLETMPLKTEVSHASFTSSSFASSDTRGKVQDRWNASFETRLLKFK